MGQKVNPHGMRVGIIKGWDTQWFADKKEFSKNLKNDYDIRKYLKDKYFACSISRITIERVAQKVIVNIFTAKSGMLIGKAGAGIEELKKEIEKIAKGKTIVINIREVKKPDADAQLLAESIAAQLEKRISFRRAMRQAMGKCMRCNAKGIKILVSGRLDGAEIARSEGYNEGSIPLHTLRADIDYGIATAHTTFGAIGVKVWVYNGEILGKVNFAKENNV